MSVSSTLNIVCMGFLAGRTQVWAEEEGIDRPRSCKAKSETPNIDERESKKGSKGGKIPM